MEYAHNTEHSKCQTYVQYITLTIHKVLNENTHMIRHR